MPTNTTDVEFKIGLSDSDKASMQAAITALVKASLITVYSSSATYALGDFVYYDGKFYKCTTAISTAEAWTSGHWTEATLNDVINKVNQAANSVENKLSKGDYDGTTGVGYSDVSDNLTPYSDESGAFQSKPMISQGTGTDNNTAIVTTGNFAQLREKQGNTLAVRQVITSKTGTTIQPDSTDWGITTSQSNAFDLTHKYLLVFKATSISANASIRVRYPIILDLNVGINYLFIGEPNNKDLAFQTRSTDGTQANVVLPDNYAVAFDITSWPADVIADLTAHPDHFPWYYNGSLAYNAGSLENSDGVKLVCTKRNIYDPSKTHNLVIPNTDFHYHGSATTITYYDKDKNVISTQSVANNSVFTTPANCVFINSSVTSNVTITPAYYKDNDPTSPTYHTELDGDYNQYYPYEEPTVVDTGSEVLREAGSVKDYKTPDGVVHRLVGEYVVEDASNFGAYTPSGATYQLFYLNISGSGAALTITNISSNRYLPSNSNLNNMPNKTIIISNSLAQPVIYIRDDSYETLESFKTAVVGLTLNYPLATPTTSQGTPFPENVDIDDYGMMYWLDENDNLVGIPQGAKFFYPVNYKGFTDDLYNRTEGDAGNVVVQSERSQLKEALGGTIRQVLCLKETLDFDNTDVVDLGTINWEYQSTYGFFRALSAISTKTYSVGTQPKWLCTKYKVANVAYDSGTLADLSISEDNSYALIKVKDSTFNGDVTAFKAAMKGVLLAYEKA